VALLFPVQQVEGELHLLLLVVPAEGLDAAKELGEVDLGVAILIERGEQHGGEVGLDSQHAQRCAKLRHRQLP
jgi:hypothetical protein